MREKFNRPFNNCDVIQCITLLLFLIVSSCVTQRNVEYIQDKNRTTISFQEAQIDDYKLKASDELYIQIGSIDDASASIFAGTTTQQTMYMGTIQPYGASLISHQIDKNGYLSLPVIGRLYVKDKSIPEVSKMIQDSLLNILNQPIVTVKLVNRYVTVIGEVRNPGHFAYSKDKLTIYDALGLAGDITDYGNRKSVIIARNENGKNERINLNLLDSKILSTEEYYLRPNDIVYIKPLRKKFWNLSQFPYTVILSTITTALLIYNVTQQ